MHRASPTEPHDRPDNGETFESFSDEIARLSDTILACERLCLLSARGLAELGISESKEGTAVTFIPGVSQNLLNKPTQLEHRTTSAQCIGALQSLLPVMGRFQLGTHESKGLAFHPIERGAAQDFKLRPLSAKIRSRIECGLAALNKPPKPMDKPSTENLATENPSLDNLPTFHDHPFRAALVLRATTPSQGLFGEVWWRSLFIVVWYLHQRKGHRRGMPNIQATASPSTAFLTSRCVDAIETVQMVFKRRFDRFEKLVALLFQLDQKTRTKRWLDSAETKKVIPEDKPGRPVIHAAYQYQTSILIPETEAWLDELACDSALPHLYAHWLENIRSKNKKSANEQRAAEDFLHDVAAGFQEAFHHGDARTERSTIMENTTANEAWIEGQMLAVRNIHKALEEKHPVRREDLDALPHWTCTKDYRQATLDAQEGVEAPDLLKEHWARHRSAAESARKTVEKFRSYLNGVFKATAELAEPALHSAQKEVLVERFLEKSRPSTIDLPAVEKQLVSDMEMGARWAEIVLNRQLAYAASHAMAQFDPSELAHAIKVVCRDGGRFRFAIILKALHSVCDVQRADGTWNCEQPFHWTESGTSMSPMSMEIASAIVSAVSALVMNPERYGASQIEISTGLRPVNAALDRFFRWLSGSIQSFPLPPCLRNEATGAKGLMLYGWCSDRIPEPGRIHSWATAAAIELLVDFRRLLQERINLLLRVEFVSNHPSDLTALSKVDPTDLMNVGKPLESGPLIARLMAFAREHRKLELAEGAWLPKKPPEADISFWSGLFSGPPGTSKTFLAEAIAAELNWPLISVSPSDFLAKGDNLIEARAQEIFSAFSAASRVVLFFDEIDELIRDRSDEKEDQRSALSFLTPSFLTKLQHLRRAAKKNEFIFILATNYKDRIDSAAIRSGRIDQQMLVVYPDEASRANIVINEIVKMKGGEKEPGRFVNRLLSTVQEHLKQIESDLNQADGRRIEGSGETSDELKLRSLEEFGTNIVGFLAEFTGFLSYQRIQDMLKVHLASRTGQEGAERLNELKGEKGRISDLFNTLCDINGPDPTRFKPEINLREYARRPKASDEVERLIPLIPERALPRTEGGSAGGPTYRERQVDSLKKAITDKEFRKTIDCIPASGLS